MKVHHATIMIYLEDSEYTTCVGSVFNLKIIQRTSEIIMSPFASNVLNTSYEDSRHRGCAEIPNFLQRHIGRSKIRKKSTRYGESVNLDSMAFIIGGTTIYHGSVHTVAKASWSVRPPLNWETWLLKQCTGSFRDCARWTFCNGVCNRTVRSTYAMLQFKAGNCREQFRCIVGVHQFDVFFLFVDLKVGSWLNCLISRLSTCRIKHHPIWEMVFDKSSHFLVINASSISTSCDEVICNYVQCLRMRSRRIDMPTTCLLSIFLGMWIIRWTLLRAFPRRLWILISSIGSGVCCPASKSTGENGTLSTAPSASRLSADPSTVGRAWNQGSLLQWTLTWCETQSLSHPSKYWTKHPTLSWITKPPGDVRVGFCVRSNS